MNYIDKLVSLLRELDDSGSLIQTNGTKLIKKNPPREDGLFADSYLHEIYAGLDAQQINALESQIGKKLPDQLVEFYGYANGLRLFAGSLSIRGFRTAYGRDVDARLPVSLEYGNVIEKPKGGVEGQIRFGWYPAQKAELVIFFDKPGEICAVPKFENGPIIYSWPGIENLLFSEFHRMRDVYLRKPDGVDFLNPISMPERH